MKTGSWDVNVVTGGMPQKIATAFTMLTENLLGAEYDPIAYLGSQIVNGTNHAILAEQTLITGKDVKNIVIMVINEKPGDIDGTGCSIVSIKSVLEDRGLDGGYNIDAKTEIPSDAQEVFDKAFAGFVGSNVQPFALLATQVVNGIKYVFAAETTMLVSPTANGVGLKSIEGAKNVALVSVFSNYSEVSIEPIF